MIWIGETLVSPGEPGVYGERVLQGYRVWDPWRSKLAALYHLGEGPELTAGTRVLYLGAANGTTASHVADYAEVVYAVERAHRPMRDLIAVARRRRNIIPVIADAARPEWYAPLVEEVDFLYQDVADPAQVAIAAANMPFLKQGGTVVVMLKTRSIDVTRDPAEVVADAVKESADRGIPVSATCWLDPYHRDHAALVGRKVS